MLVLVVGYKDSVGFIQRANKVGTYKGLEKSFYLMWAVNGDHIIKLFRGILQSVQLYGVALYITINLLNGII